MRRFEGAHGEVEMWLGIPENEQPGLSTLAGLPIPLEGGGSVPLSAVSKLELARTPPHIRREDRLTTAWISVEFDKEVVSTTEMAQVRVEQEMESVSLPDGYAWSYRTLFSHRAIWQRRPRQLGALPAYIAGAYLYKRANRLWPFLIRHGLVARAWRPLIELSRRRHVRFRERLARRTIRRELAPGHVVSPGV